MASSLPKRRKKPSKAELEAARVAIWPENGLCPLCGRIMVRGESLNEHHLIPKSYGGTIKYVMHRTCHSKIHSVFTEQELATAYCTFESLRAHPAMQSFVKWIRKQHPEAMVRHRSPSAH